VAVVQPEGRHELAGASPDLDCAGGLFGTPIYSTTTLISVVAGPAATQPSNAEARCVDRRASSVPSAAGDGDDPTPGLVAHFQAHGRRRSQCDDSLCNIGDGGAHSCLGSAADGAG
jgi:hypothetical protein